MSALGGLEYSCDLLIELLKHLDFPEELQRRLISKIMNIVIRCTYYIFCCRNKDCTSPDWLTSKPFQEIYFFSFSFVCCIVNATLKQQILHCRFLERCIIVV